MAKHSASLEELLQMQLQELMDVEKQITRALPKLIKAVSDADLKGSLRDHLEVTQGQVRRLSEVFDSLEIPARSRPCKGMKAILEEGSEMLGQGLDGSLLDAAIASGARRVEHYEMACYEGARTIAQQLGRTDATRLLAETLKEEIAADKTLAQVSTKLLKTARAGNEGRMARTAPRATTGRTRTTRTGSARRKTASGHGATRLVDHNAIQEWAEERNARPACVKGTGGRNDVGMIRLDFPGYTGSESLQPISWSDWFDKFDESNLALMVQDVTARGQRSNFNKLVKRTASEQRPRVRAAR